MFKDSLAEPKLCHHGLNSPSLQFAHQVFSNHVGPFSHHFMSIKENIQVRGVGYKLTSLVLLPLSSPDLKRCGFEQEQEAWGGKLGRVTFAKEISSCTVFQSCLAVLIGIVYLFCWVVRVYVTEQWSQISWKIILFPKVYIHFHPYSLYTF